VITRSAIPAKAAAVQFADIAHAVTLLNTAEAKRSIPLPPMRATWSPRRTTRTRCSRR
jgi:hypothetical protein